jgi:hypothetical protein
MTTTASSVPSPRLVLHVDIDAFFAAIEQQRNPSLRGKPVIVGAGVIASCSYEARRFGLKAGMTLSEAKRRCPQAVILDGHAQTYRCFAEVIFECCRALRSLGHGATARRHDGRGRRPQARHPRGYRTHRDLRARTESHARQARR